MNDKKLRKTAQMQLFGGPFCPKYFEYSAKLQKTHGSTLWPLWGTSLELGCKFCKKWFLSKAQKYSMNNYWKHLENFFKVAQCRKTQKRPFRLIQRFYKPKTSKKMQGGTL